MFAMMSPQFQVNEKNDERGLGYEVLLLSSQGRKMVLDHCPDASDSV
jgi:hypothetical protein